MEYYISFVFTCQLQNYKYYIRYKSGIVEGLSMQQYLESIKPYLSDIINNFKNSVERKIPMTMKAKFLRSADSNEKSIMYTQGNLIRRIDFS